MRWHSSSWRQRFWSGYQGAQNAHAALPSGFSDSVVMSGLTNPTQVAFASDGSVLIAQKNGKIFSFKNFADKSPTLVADLSTEVDDYWDRGLLGLAVPPDYPTNQHLYVLYARDAVIGGTPPTLERPVPDAPRTEHRRLHGERPAGAARPDQRRRHQEDTLVDGWCQQFPSHSIGTVVFGEDGYLYAGGGEGASFNASDYGQFGNSTAPDKATRAGTRPVASAPC